MERPGEYLKRERELRGVALDDVCAALKLSKKKIKALEEDDYANLPHSTYVKGFIKSYCRYLGLDEGDAVLRYEVYLRDMREREDAKAAKEEAPKQPETVIGAVSQSAKKSGRGVGVDKTLVISVAILAVFIGVSAYAVLFSGGKATEPKVLVESKKEDAAAVSPVEADKAVKEAAPQPRAEAEVKKPATDVHTLELAAIADVWVKVEADGKEPREMTLRKGERKKLDSASSYLLTVGNAGNLELILDGKSEGVGGAAGRVVKVKISGGEVVRTQLEVKKKTVAAPDAQTPAAPASAPVAPQNTKNNGGGVETKNTEIKSE